MHLPPSWSSGTAGRLCSGNHQKNRDPDKYDEIHYEGVAENSGGEEVKAVTFDVSKELIQSIQGGTVEAKDIPEKAENLYILYTLTDEAETTADSKTAETTSESESTSESAS